MIHVFGRNLPCNLGKWILYVTYVSYFNSCRAAEFKQKCMASHFTHSILVVTHPIIDTLQTMHSNFNTYLNSVMHIHLEKSTALW